MDELLRTLTPQWIIEADSEELENVVRQIHMLPRCDFPTIERLYERADLIDRELNSRRLREGAAAAERQHHDLLDHMKDSELRGFVLKFLYDHRRDSFIAFGGVQGAAPIPYDIDQRDWFRACKQLAEHNLINWEAGERDASTGELWYCVVEINAFGTQVIEGDAKSPISVVVDQSQQIQVTGSQGVQISGAYSSQQQTISDAFDKVITALDNATVSEGEKKEVRSLLLKVLESKAFAAALGPAAQYLIAKLSS